jgi:hypothetical protein
VHQLFAGVGRAGTSLPLTHRMTVQVRALATPSRALFRPTPPPPSLRALRFFVVFHTPHSAFHTPHFFPKWPKNRVDFFGEVAIGPCFLIPSEFWQAKLCELIQKFAA